MPNCPDKTMSPLPPNELYFSYKKNRWDPRGPAFYLPRAYGRYATNCTP